MSGTNTYNNASRRKFLWGALSLGALGGLTFALKGKIPFLKPANVSIPGTIRTPSFAYGHLLKGLIDKQPTREIATEYAIVGGGIAGLSAGYWLKTNGIRDYTIFELEPEAGGNSAFGQNEVSAYPLGAHYLPLPNLHNKELLNFLVAEDIITGFDEQGLPLYNELFLCFDPEERLYIHHHWQEGLVPQYGLPEKDLKEIKRFQDEMEVFKEARGEDGKFAFDIPLDIASSDAKYRVLDNQIFSHYLKEQGYTSSYLLWYLNYCIKDDYGATIDQISAWAGIHYFAARKAKAANAGTHDVLTWPEGNGYLMKRLKQYSEGSIKTNYLVYSAEMVDGKVVLYAIETASREVVKITAAKCIMATPQFVNSRIVKGRALELEAFQYAPWFVANITVNNISEKNGTPLCWDNVIYDSPSVGFVHAGHQNIGLDQARKVFTYYYPLTADDPRVERVRVFKADYEFFKGVILKDLKQVYPEIEKYIENIEVWIWGHGMIRPSPGFIWGEARAKAKAPMADLIHFAHTDLSGISIFEEAFYQGIKAAKACIGKTS